MDNGNQLSLPFHSGAEAASPADSSVVGLRAHSARLGHSLSVPGQVLSFPTSGTFKAKDRDSALLNRILNSVRLFT
ncbi:hypothetical protein [Pseudomonas syringae]|uniref:hypothetical protein n=1 Tax=Pseudomonas syringae TaxID=317 RepID=UPI0013729412|nr:hypothetical protein [Pseudomonas syringae]NAO52415.1 hypothetical protein [Pseudomonas syringae]